MSVGLGGAFVLVFILVVIILTLFKYVILRFLLKEIAIGQTLLYAFASALFFWALIFFVPIRLLTSYYLGLLSPVLVMVVMDTLLMEKLFNVDRRRAITNALILNVASLLLITLPSMYSYLHRL